MGKKSSDDKKSSSSTRSNLRRLVGMIARFSGNSRRILTLSLLMLLLEQVTALSIPIIVPEYVVNYVTQHIGNLAAKPGSAVPLSSLIYLCILLGFDPILEHQFLCTCVCTR